MGFSDSKRDPQFSLSFFLTTNKSSGKSWMSEKANLAPCLEMMPQNSVITKPLEAAGLQQVATSADSISERTSTGKVALRGAGEPGSSCQSKPAHTNSLGEKELSPVSVGTAWVSVHSWDTSELLAAEGQATGAACHHNVGTQQSL